MHQVESQGNIRFLVGPLRFHFSTYVRCLANRYIVPSEIALTSVICGQRTTVGPVKR